MNSEDANGTFTGNTFQVILTGTFAPAVDREKSLDRLAALFKTDVARVARIMDQAPVVVQRKLSREKAEKYKSLVEAAGAVCDIQPESVFQPSLIDETGVQNEAQTLYQPPAPAAHQEEAPERKDTKPQTLDPPAWQSLGIGLAVTLVVLVIPFLSYIFHYMITLVHELGHTVFGWLFGYPSIPAFDFVYGGGITMHRNQSSLIIVLIYILLAGLFYVFRKNHLTLLLLVAGVAGYTLAVFTSFHHLIILFMGHGTELIFAGIFFYRALSGSSIIVAVERPLYAFLAFFILFKDFRFAYQLYSSPAHRQMYAAAKGGGHWMDFSRIAREFLGVQLESVAGMFFMICLLVIPATYLFFRYKKQIFHLFSRILTLHP